MLWRKDTNNISELNGFSISGEKVCQTILWIIRSLKLDNKQLSPTDEGRLIYTSTKV